MMMMMMMMMMMIIYQNLPMIIYEWLETAYNLKTMRMLMIFILIL